MTNALPDQFLSHADRRLMDILWDVQPIASPDLCRLAEQRLGWKRTTTYTVLKRLAQKGYLENRDATVRALTERETVRTAESRRVVAHGFEGSLPQFVAAFLDDGMLSEEEAREIERLLAEYRGKDTP